jgi:oligopeptide transport system substrate-binding protein
MFQRGELDFIGQPLVDLSSEVISRLETAGELRQLPSTEILWCAINTRHPLLNHPKIRKALATAIDRSELVDYILPKGFRAASGILPVQMSKMAKQPFKDGDRQKAKQLFLEALNEMGLSKVDIPSLTLLYSPKEIVEKVVHIVSDQWRKSLGLDIKLECVELKMRQARMKGGAFELGTYIWFSWIDDPLYTLHNYNMKDTLYNYTGWSNPDFTQYLDQFKKAQDKQERSNFLRQAEEVIMRDLPLVPIFYGALTFAHKSSLKGIVISPYYELDLRWAYFEQPAPPWLDTAVDL